jgi:hypothetical protein
MTLVGVARSGVAPIVTAVSSSTAPVANALVHEFEHGAGHDRRGPRDRAFTVEGVTRVLQAIPAIPALF